MTTHSRTRSIAVLTLLCGVLGPGAYAADTPVAPPPAPLNSIPATTVAPVTTAKPSTPSTSAPIASPTPVASPTPSTSAPVAPTPVASPVPSPQATPAAPKLDHMALGRSAKEKKDWKTAIAEFQAAVDEEPSNADAHNLLAYSYRKSGNLPMAFTHYDIALRLNPDHRGAHEYRGEAYVQSGDLAKAKADLAALERICGKGCEEYLDLLEVVSDAELKTAAPSAIVVTTVTPVVTAPVAKSTPKVKAPKTKKPKARKSAKK